MTPTNSHAGSGHGSPRASSRDDDLHNDDVAHEASDINIRAVVMSTVVVAVTCMFAAAVVYILFFYVFEKQAKARDPRMSPLATSETKMPPTTNTTPTFGSAPDPRLLTNEPRYLGSTRAEWQKELDTYGWVNQAGGVARIPIDRAKELLIERGLAVRAEPVTDPRLGTNAAASGEYSSGRTITQPVTAPAGGTQAPPPAPAPAEHKPAEHK